MFGFGNTDDPAAEIRWSQLLPLLEDDVRRAAIEREYPEPGSESFLSGLRRVKPELASEILSAGRQLDAAGPLANYPSAHS